MRSTLAALALAATALPFAPAHADDEHLTTSYVWLPADLSGEEHLEIFACEVQAHATAHSVPLTTTATCTINGAGRTVTHAGPSAAAVITGAFPNGAVERCVSGTALYEDLESGARYLVSTPGPQCVVLRPL